MGLATVPLEQQLAQIERKLWTNNADIYETILLEEALLVFPETGVITRDFAVNAIRQENAEGRRWAEVEFDDIRCLTVAPDTALLAYRVRARWENETKPIMALASSLYVRRSGSWRLAFHQQSYRLGQRIL